ncbi:heterokaryon incompatibility protein-domain-containing protein [Lenzites betulinus]|nr:heterokaryon incompatibility protein-domain-containing protein [Lenzites betulinus]
MRLIDTHTGLFHWVDNPSDVQYAILSHVWVPGEELTYEGMLAIHSAAHSSPNPNQHIFDAVPTKVREFCAFAREHGFLYVWTDTCCIDKSSSAELSEAINSMYKWYQLASLCVAYLADVDDPRPDMTVSPHPHSFVPDDDTSGWALARGDPADLLLGPSSMFRFQFSASKWFKRGWTLQELVAPRFLLFACRTWRTVGTKDSFAEVIEEITGIMPAILTHKTSVDDVSVAVRMSWAFDRVTTREEDRAYSLMGIFGVNLPTIYGEGTYAFVRLQEEILKRMPDATLFVWGRVMVPTLDMSSVESLHTNMGPDQPSHTLADTQLFAASPSEFERGSMYTDGPTADQLHVAPHRWLTELLKKPDLPFPEYTITCYGVRARLPLMTRTTRSKSGKVWVERKVAFALLCCHDNQERPIALMLNPRDETNRVFRVGLALGQEGLNTRDRRNFARAITLPRDWIQSKASLFVVSEIYIPYADISWRQPNPPPVLPLVGVSQSPNPEDLFNVVLTPWSLSILECEGFLCFQDSVHTKCSAWTAGGAPPTSRSLPTRLFHLVNSRMHIHITAGPCPCANGHGLLRVEVAYNWRPTNGARTTREYMTPRELLNLERSSAENPSPHNTLIHVTTWRPAKHSSDGTVHREFSLEQSDEVFYILRLTMQTQPSGGISMSIEVIDMRSKQQKAEGRALSNALVQPSAFTLGHEAKKDMKRLGILRRTTTNRAIKDTGTVVEWT